MNAKQNQLRQSTRSTPSGHPHASTHQIHSVNPLDTLKDPSKAHARPYLYSSRSLPIHVPLPSPNLSNSVSTPSNRHLSLQPPPTRPLPVRPSSIALPRDDNRAVPSKRARDYTPSPPTLYPVSPVPPSSERPAKRPRVDAGRSKANHGGSQPPVFAKPHPPRQPSTLGENPPRPKPRHPLAVDYGRPIQPMVPQPPFCRLNPRQNRVPLPPYPENPEAERLLEDGLGEPVDPATAREFGGLMWKQQRRVWDDQGGYSDPFVSRRIHISLLDDRPSSSGEGETPAQLEPEMVALYGPPLRKNESTHLGERLTNPSAPEVDDDRDVGFEEVLDLYRGAVQGSALSMELELAVGGDSGLGVGWEAASSLEVGIKRGSGEPRESRIFTPAEYKRVVEAEKVMSGPAIPREEPPLGIEWSYGCCGYAAGKVVNVHSAGVTAGRRKGRLRP